MRVMHLGWNEYDDMVRRLYSKLEAREFDQIVGISRSGLVLAVHLSHLLGIREFGCVDVQRTNDDAMYADKTDPQINYWAGIKNIEGKRILLVDDIVGGGDTMRLVRGTLEQMKAHVTTVVLMVNLDNFKDLDLDNLVDHYGKAVHSWVSFPWCK